MGGWGRRNARWLVLLLAPLGSTRVSADEDGPPKDEKIDPEVALRRAGKLERNAVRLWEEKRQDEALRTLDAALELAVKALGDASPEILPWLEAWAHRTFEVRKLPEARRLYEWSLRVSEATWGPDHLNTVGSLIGLASVLQEFDDFETARRLHERAIDSLSRMPGIPPSALAIARLRLARVLVKVGEVEVARPLLEGALETLERTLGAEDPSTLAATNDLAQVLQAMGQLDAARPLLERIARLIPVLKGPESDEAGAALSNLAGLLIAEGDAESARPLLERVAVIHEKNWGPDSSRRALALQNLASVYLSLGRYEDARRHAEIALSIDERTFGKDHLQTALAIGMLAGAHSALGHHEEARSLYLRQLSAMERTLGPDQPWSIAAVLSAATAAAKSGHREEATTLFERGLRAGERAVRRQLAVARGPERLALVATIRGNLERFLLASEILGTTGYAEVLRNKGIVARADAAERVFARESDAETRARADGLRQVQRRLAGLANASPAAKDAEGRRAWQERFAQATAEEEAISRALAAASAGFREAMARLEVGVDRLRDALPPDAALVDILRSGPAYVAWVVRRDREVERVSLGDARILEEATEGFVAATRRAESGSDATWLSAGRRLRRLVLAPLEKHLGEGVRILYLAPDGALATVPFAALPAAESTETLDRTYRVVNVAFTQDLVPREAREAPGTGSLLIGEVDYDRASDAAPSATASPRRRASFDALPASGEENSLDPRTPGRRRRGPHRREGDRGGRPGRRARPPAPPPCDPRLRQGRPIPGARAAA